MRHIEVELMKAYHVLLLITIGDTETSIQHVIEAVQDISDAYTHNLEEATKDFSGGHHDGDALVYGQSNDKSIRAMDSAYDASDLHASIMETLPTPVVVLSPRQAFYADMEEVPLAQALGRISGETITYYPPGIPCLGVGEEITEEVLAYIEQKWRDGYVPNGARDRNLDTIIVCK